MAQVLKLIFTILVLQGTIEGSEITEEEIPSFICFDGSKIPLANVCDGLPHCVDSSDESAKLCHHIVCPVSKFKCVYGACTNRTSRCDGFMDCIDGSDEFFCDKETDCSDQKYRCPTSSECIPISFICDGLMDCLDGKDEDSEICKNFICPESAFQCTYGGCVYQEVVCDGFKDCVDGTDEDENICTAMTCENGSCRKRVCRDDEFSCENGDQCIPLNKVCDGMHHCRDASDEKEEMCQQRECPENYFRCAYGACIPENYWCNGALNCYDWSDEDVDTCGKTLPEGACRLPRAKPGIYYAVKDCERCRPGNVVPEFTRLDFKCYENLPLEGASVVYCQGNRWLPSIPVCPDVENAIKCPPIESPGAIKRCEALWGPEAGWISCNQTVPIGTRISLECREFYERKRGSSHITCLHDGTWSQAPLSCQPICGIKTSTETALIIKGWDAPVDETLPWHATLFSHEKGDWNFFCGGTLITESVVLTAAHCVWKTAPETIKVLLASNSSNYTNQNVETQIRDVVRIEHQNSYQDHEGNYNSDLALIILKEPALINSYVLPACIDWMNNYDITQRVGEIGIIAGMGVTENNTFSPTLKLVSSQVISEKDCRAKEMRDFRKYLTYTSFCAGWTNGSGVCNGDSGGGFLLQRPNSSIWEIHGIVSLSPRRLGALLCDTNYYTVFTKVSTYIKWIKNMVKSIPVSETYEENYSPNKDNILLK